MQSTDNSLANQSGAAFRSELNSILGAHLSNHVGTSEPSYIITGGMWLNNTTDPWQWNFYDGATSWAFGEFNVANNTFSLKSTLNITAAGTAGLVLKNSGGTTVLTVGASNNTVVTFAGNAVVTGALTANGKFAAPDKSELTIASGVITITGIAHTVDTQADAASDDLDTISGGSDGEIIILRAENAARTVIIRHNTGNILTADTGSITLDDTSKTAVLQYDAALSKWLVLSSAINTSVNIMGNLGGGSKTIDLSLGLSVSATVNTSTTTFTFSNPKATGNETIFTFRLTNGGSQIVNWPASVDWAGGVAPTLTASGVDELSFKTINGGTTWVGLAALDVK